MGQRLSGGRQIILIGPLVILLMYYSDTDLLSDLIQSHKFSIILFYLSHDLIIIEILLLAVF
jgi:hypothetical protein